MIEDRRGFRDGRLAFRLGLRLGALTCHANPLDHLKHGGENLPVLLVLVVVFPQVDERDRLGLVLLDRFRDLQRQRLNRLLPADAGGGVARLQPRILAADALQREPDLQFPTLTSVGRRRILLRQRLGHGDQLLSEHLAFTPRDPAVDERERIDGPTAVGFDFSLVGAVHPVAGPIHLEDDDSARPNVRLNGPQRRGD